MMLSVVLGVECAVVDGKHFSVIKASTGKRDERPLEASDRSIR